MTGIGMFQGDFHPFTAFALRGSCAFHGSEVVVLVVGGRCGLTLVVNVFFSCFLGYIHVFFVFSFVLWFIPGVNDADNIARQHCWRFA